MACAPWGWGDRPHGFEGWFAPTEEQAPTISTAGHLGRNVFPASLARWAKAFRHGARTPELSKVVHSAASRTRPISETPPSQQPRFCPLES